MSVAPASSTPRGEVALQPSYFTSSIYVNALKDDISTLVLKFYEAYSNNTPTPFKVFKSIWTSMGWHWLHFKVFDHRTRKTFLDVTLRLFLERTVKTEAPFTRVVALFGLYTLFFTQIESVAPPLYAVKNIPIPFDHHTNLMTLPETLSSPHLLPLQPHVRYILKRLHTENVFFLLPKSEDGPMNPRALPREIYAPEGTSYTLESSSQKRKGRPAKREKGKKARHALEGLDVWLSKEETDDEEIDVPPTEVVEYQTAKSRAMEALKEEYDESSLTTAANDIGRTVLARLKDAEAAMGGEGNSSGVQRLEKAVQGIGSSSEQLGIFSLLEGAGQGRAS